MSNVLARIHEDEAEYEDLCEQFGEAIQRTESGRIDTYGQHAESLRKRNRDLQQPVRSGLDRTTSGGIGQP